MQYRVIDRNAIYGVAVRDFVMLESAETWCRQVGKAYLIPQIQAISADAMPAWEYETYLSAQRKEDDIRQSYQDKGDSCN